MAADQEKVLNLLDSYWFEYGVFEKKPSLSSSTTSEQNPVLQIHEELEKPKLSRIQTHHVRSHSDQFLSSRDSFSSDFLSPNSVLLTPKLETILSGKEVIGFSENFPDQEDLEKPIENRVSNERRRRRRRKRKGSSSSKSLSDLEFQELKGFMDLGFVFSEEDKNSSLVSIIPGLQRLGRKEIANEEEEEEENAIDEIEVSRPYLSEAWDDLEEKKKRENPLMNWRIPSLGGNKMDIKDHLRFWAHTVASTVT